MFHDPILKMRPLTAYPKDYKYPIILRFPIPNGEFLALNNLGKTFWEYLEIFSQSLSPVSKIVLIFYKYWKAPIKIHWHHSSGTIARQARLPDNTLRRPSKHAFAKDLWVLSLSAINSPNNWLRFGADRDLWQISTRQRIPPAPESTIELEKQCSKEAFQIFSKHFHPWTPLQHLNGEKTFSSLGRPKLRSQRLELLHIPGGSPFAMAFRLSSHIATQFLQ